VPGSEWPSGRHRLAGDTLDQDLANRRLAVGGLAHLVEQRPKQCRREVLDADLRCVLETFGLDLEGRADTSTLGVKRSSGPADRRVGNQQLCEPLQNLLGASGPLVGIDLDRELRQLGRSLLSSNARSCFAVPAGRQASGES
jgi:hypothetical protein